METLILTRADVERVLTPRVAIDAVEKAFRAYGLGQVEMPPKNYMTFKTGDLRTMPAYVRGQGFNIAGVKSVNVHPGNRRYDLPTVMGVIVLTNPKNGFPLAVLDGTWLTGMRTGAAGALAAKLLSRAGAESVGFVGCGAQARMQLACLLEVRGIKRIKVWRRTPKSRSAGRFGDWAREAFGLETAVLGNIDRVAAGVDMLVTTTPSRKPLVSEVEPGIHINAFGADAAGKQEIDGRVLRRAKVVIDDWEQASHSGEINVPLKRRQIFKKHIYGDLGEIAAEKKPGRVRDDEITLFDSTGLAIQDIACADVVYERLKDDGDVRKVAFF